MHNIIEISYNVFFWQTWSSFFVFLTTFCINITCKREWEKINKFNQKMKKISIPRGGAELEKWKRWIAYQGKDIDQ